MQDVNMEQFTSRLDETLPVIKEVSAQFQNPVSVTNDIFLRPHYFNWPQILWIIEEHISQPLRSDN